MSTPLAELSLPQLRCFVAVVEAGSFAEAGRRLGMSTSAISKMIARFEAAYGLKLLHRSTHALSLTEDGERLIDAAREAVRGVAALEASLGDVVSDGGAGRVRISAPVAFARCRIVPLLPAFVAALPGIHLDLRASNELVDLADAGVDLAIRGGSLEGIPGHVAQPWFRAPWVVCASPDYLARHGTPATPEELAAHVLIGFRNQQTGAVRPWRLGNAVLERVQPLIEIDDGESVWAAALTGVGIAMAPLWLAADDLTSGRMVEVLRPWRSDETQLWFLRRDRRHAPRRVEAIIEFLKANTPAFSRDLIDPE